MLTNHAEHTRVLQVKTCVCPSSIPLPLSCIAYKLQLEGKTRLKPLKTSSFRRSLTSLSVSNWTPIGLLKIYQNNKTGDVKNHKISQILTKSASSFMCWTHLLDRVVAPSRSATADFNQKFEQWVSINCIKKPRPGTNIWASTSCYCMFALTYPCSSMSEVFKTRFSKHPCLFRTFFILKLGFTVWFLDCGCKVSGFTESLGPLILGMYYKACKFKDELSEQPYKTQKYCQNYPRLGLVIQCLGIVDHVSTMLIAPTMKLRKWHE